MKRKIETVRGVLPGDTKVTWFVVLIDKLCFWKKSDYLARINIPRDWVANTTYSAGLKSQMEKKLSMSGFSQFAPVAQTGTTATPNQKYD